jgi:hypothetical protein
VFKHLFCLVGLIFSFSVEAMKLTEAETKKFQTCFAKAEKACRRAKDIAVCLAQETQKFDSACKKVYKKTTTQMAHVGGSCIGLMKLCPLKFGAKDEDFKKFEKCMASKMDQIPPKCKNTMMQMYNANDKGKDNNKKMKYKDLLKEYNKNQKNKKGKNVQVKTK